MKNIKEKNINNKGNVVIFFICIVAIVIIILSFMVTIYFSQINSMLYNMKLDMYSINKSAIISVNKGLTSRGTISYDEKEYEKYFKELLIKNYNLDDNMKNDNGLIKEVQLVEYSIGDIGKKDNYTNLNFDDTTIHSVIKVKVKPIIMQNVLENAFCFELHEDVALNKFIT